MKLKYILLVFGAALVSYASPVLIINFLKRNNQSKEVRPASLKERESTFFDSRNDNNGGSANYLSKTKEAITSTLQQSGVPEEFQVSNIVFTSQKTKWVAGQKQVALSFTYELILKNSKPEKNKGSILLASDEAGNLFSTSIKI